MSFLVTAWAETAPVADVYERAIVTCMAHKAASDGTGAYRSVAAMAAFALCDEKTIERRLAQLRKRGLIAYGDQRLTRHLPADKRPKVYDLLVPYEWYSAAQREEVNEDRARRGLGELAAQDRPPIKPPAKKGRKPRSDRGQPRPKTATADQTTKTADPPSSEAVPEPPGGLIDPPATPADGGVDESSEGSNSPPAGGLTVPSRGVYKTPNTVHLPSGENSPSESVPAGGETPPPAPRRTDHSGSVDQVVTTELELISNHLNARADDEVVTTAQAISQEHPELGQAECYALAVEQLAAGDQVTLDHDQAMLAIRRTLAETPGRAGRGRRRPAKRAARKPGRGTDRRAG